MRPLCIDLFCGLGGWAEGFLAEGYQVVGFDIEQHDYGTGGYPGQLVLQDVRTLHGSQFRHAAVIVASPPCQAYSYRAMPWKRARELPPPDNTLFDACFRIQREACEAAGRYVPLLVENVCGAQKWIGRARWHHGSFFLWGDVPALMPFTQHAKNRHLGGGSWYAVTDHWQSNKRNNPARKNPDGRKLTGNNSPRLWSERRIQRLQDAFRDESDNFYLAHSGSSARKAASAMIAKIPFALAQHIARVYKPQSQERNGRSPTATIPSCELRSADTKANTPCRIPGTANPSKPTADTATKEKAAVAKTQPENASGFRHTASKTNKGVCFDESR